MHKSWLIKPWNTTVRSWQLLQALVLVGDQQLNSPQVFLLLLLSSASCHSFPTPPRKDRTRGQQILQLNEDYVSTRRNFSNSNFFRLLNRNSDTGSLCCPVGTPWAARNKSPFASRPRHWEVKYRLHNSRRDARSLDATSKPRWVNTRSVSYRTYHAFRRNPAKMEPVQRGRPSAPSAAARCGAACRPTPSPFLPGGSVPATFTLDASSLGWKQSKLEFIKP